MLTPTDTGCPDGGVKLQPDNCSQSTNIVSSGNSDKSQPGDMPTRRGYAPKSVMKNRANDFSRAKNQAFSFDPESGKYC